MALPELLVDSEHGLVSLGFQIARLELTSRNLVLEASAQHKGAPVGFVAVQDAECEPQPMVAFTEYWYLASVYLRTVGPPSDRLAQLLDSLYDTRLGISYMAPETVFSAMVFTRGEGAAAPQYLSMSLLAVSTGTTDEFAVSIDVDRSGHQVWLRQTREVSHGCRRAFVGTLGRGAAEQRVEADEAG